MRLPSLRTFPSSSSNIDASKIQRAAPTCTVSLTSVSVTASVSAGAVLSSSIASASTSMDVDNNIQKTSSDGVDCIPSGPSAFLARAKLLIQFPTTKTKRTHSLLRPSTVADSPRINATPHVVTEPVREEALNEENEEAEREFELELPARKRVRTCAMVSSSPTTNKGRTLGGHTPSTTSRSSSIPSEGKSESLDEPARNFQQAASKPPSRPGHNSLQPSPPAQVAVAAEASSQVYLTTLQTQPNNLIHFAPLSSSSRLRQSPSVDNVCTMLFLYRTLVYGTQVRFNNWSQAPAFLEAQDAMLALRLRTLLIGYGLRPKLLIVDLDAIAREGTPPDDPVAEQGCSEWMQMIIAASAAKEFRHTCHLEPSMTSILSYQQLVAKLSFRNNTPITLGSGKSARSWKRKRITNERAKGPSKLRQSFTQYDVDMA